MKFQTGHDDKYKVVCVSGYFTVLHKGHVRMFKEAKKLGYKLVVIVNNNEQQIKKKGKLIVDAEDIIEIIKEFTCVDCVIKSIDLDETVCDSLYMVGPDIFANGGDRKAGNIPEYELCKKEKIEMVFGIGGEKVESSTDILNRSK